jgi:hypothetical protein
LLQLWLIRQQQHIQNSRHSFTPINPFLIQPSSSLVTNCALAKNNHSNHHTNDIIISQLFSLSLGNRHKNGNNEVTRARFSSKHIYVSTSVSSYDQLSWEMWFVCKRRSCH